VKVSGGTLERALLVMNQVLAVLERQGTGVKISEQGHTTALINGGQVSFGIEEPIRRVVVQKPRVPNPTDRWDYDKVVTHEPGGKLALVIYSTTWGQNAQRARWSDAKVRWIETLVADFVAGLLRTAVALRRQEEDRKKCEAEKQKRVRERAQLQKDIQEEETNWSNSIIGLICGSVRNACVDSFQLRLRKPIRSLPRSSRITRLGSGGRQSSPTGSTRLSRKSQRPYWIGRGS
jgi:hypothetical protein